MSVMLCLDKSIARFDAVSHNGTCYLACIAKQTKLSIFDVVQNFLKMISKQYIPVEVKQWATNLDKEFKQLESGRIKALSSRAYVTSEALLAYSRLYNVTFVFVKRVSDCKKRDTVEIIGVISSDIISFGSLIVINVQGQKFDNWLPAPGKEEDFADRIIPFAEVFLLSYICSHHNQLNLINCSKHLILLIPKRELHWNFCRTPLFLRNVP